MSQKDIGRVLGELNNLIHREIMKNEYTNFKYDESVPRSSTCILLYLHTQSNNNVFQKDLEEEFSVRRSTMSKVLTALEQKGYIKRVSVSEDKRLKKIVITSKADNLIDALKSDREKLEAKIVRGISESELNTLRSLLNKIKDNLKEDQK
ncbi:MAG: MarR family transcriptional regulator [Ruminococcaceae bacterium]|nr:MarR family transcriptional regulator [Oscillospiraceae bacterium]